MGKKEARRTALYSTCGLRWSRNIPQICRPSPFQPYETWHGYSKERKEHNRFHFLCPNEEENPLRLLFFLMLLVLMTWGLMIKSEAYAGKRKREAQRKSTQARERERERERERDKVEKGQWNKKLKQPKASNG
eukprot:TRINITY_DN48269_c0_g1_i1.p1 TRINITY_DN48269_c0_g1~~TRINITY_DN48269_c0_g1_i1.p1  ORF type:complete len:133 (+),score=31.62 TRINITY_DN48269_c0_g1_i1:417-815(+)